MSNKALTFPQGLFIAGMIFLAGGIIYALVAYAMNYIGIRNTGLNPSIEVSLVLGIILLVAGLLLNRSSR